MITQVEKIVHPTQHTELQLARAKVDGLVQGLIEGMPQSSTWDTGKKRLCQGFSPVLTKMHAAFCIHFRSQGTNESFTRIYPRFAELVHQATVT